MSYLEDAPRIPGHGEYGGTVFSGPGLSYYDDASPKIVAVDPDNGLVKIQWKVVVHQTHTGTEFIDPTGDMNKYDVEIHTFTAEVALSNVTDVSTGHMTIIGNAVTDPDGVAADF